MSAFFICLACGKEKPASPRSAGRQSYCGDKPCQQARKTAWQRRSLTLDHDHRANQRQSQEAWCRANPGYWTEYRSRHPDKAERNRRLQARRDRKRRHRQSKEFSLHALAKMDAFAAPNSPELQANVEYWLVPVLAKMDVLRVKIVVISDS